MFNRISIYIFWFICVSILSACGGSGSEEHASSENGPMVVEPTSAVELVNFNVLGSDGVGGQTTESPLVDEGEFGISWQVTNYNEVYVAKAYLSADESLDSNDIEIYTQECIPEFSCLRSPSESESCVVVDGSSIACPDQESGLYDISDLLTEIPKTIYVVFEICDLDRSLCSFQSADLTFI